VKLNGVLPRDSTYYRGLNLDLKRGHAITTTCEFFTPTKNNNLVHHLREIQDLDALRKSLTFAFSIQSVYGIDYIFLFIPMENEAKSLIAIADLSLNSS
jgi:hypothetical protein